ncbi:MAG: 6-pyruvoyl tetrahydrobiopterin [Planctomycetota bacterium]|nr:MAG: 6-pyruvoyl tetrahydrobiopterin [Planctomycetota bacterium]
MAAMLLTREFSFEAAHHLTKLPSGPEPVHGHTWRLNVTLEGPVQPDGMVFDFVKLGDVVEKKVLKKLDHADLNRVVANPSAERVALWVWKQLEALPLLSAVQVWECEGCSVTYRGEREKERV